MAFGVVLAAFGCWLVEVSACKCDFKSSFISTTFFYQHDHCDDICDPIRKYFNYDPVILVFLPTNFMSGFMHIYNSRKLFNMGKRPFLNKMFFSLLVEVHCVDLPGGFCGTGVER